MTLDAEPKEKKKE